MNKLLKRISLTVTLLAACGIAVWGDPSVTASLTADEGSIDVSWTTSGFSSDIVTQSVEYSLDQSIWNGVAGITSESTSVTISRLNNGTTYYVRVSANDGTGTYSDTKSATTPSVSPSSPAVTLSCTDATSTTVSLSWVYSAVLTIKNITLAIDDDAPIALTKTAELAWPTSYTVTGLSKGTNHKFQIEVYYDDSGVTKDITDIIYVNTLNTSGCSFQSTEKDTKDASWGNKCSFTDGHPYTVLCKTVSTNPLEVEVTYTKPDNISPTGVWLGVKKNSDDTELKLEAQMSNIGSGVYYRKITAAELSSWGISSVGDSILVAVKNTVADCSPGNMYCTKFVGYAIGTGCNEAYDFVFARRSEDQTTFTLNCSHEINRFAYRRSGSIGEFTYRTLDEPTDTYTLGIEEFDLGSYEFVIYPVDGDTDIKLLHAVY